MSIFTIFKHDPLKQKILGIKEDMDSIVSKVCTEYFRIEWYGAYDITPQYLVYWVCVKSDEMKTKLKTNLQLNIDLRCLLVKYDYPEAARDFVKIDFESQETVNRESNGNWHEHFQ